MTSSSPSSSYSASPLDSLHSEEEDKQQWEDEELIFLLSKEQQICSGFVSDTSLRSDRREAVEWMLKVNSYFDFSTLTAILSINYLDRFLSTTHHLHQGKKPRMIQLAAVACLSLAAKFEEIHVPLLLDLQVEGTKYVFEAKSIQRMEVLVLSTLEWKMNPVTPISFVHHIIRRLGLKCHLRRCEQLLLSIAADWRLVGCLPSAVATAAMMHVIRPSDPLHNHILPLLNLTKEKVKHCYHLILEGAPEAGTLSNQTAPPSSAAKRKCIPVPRSPNGVIDGCNFSSDSSNDSTTLANAASSSVSSSPDQRASEKKKRVYEQYMPLRVFVDTVGNPR